MYWREDEEGDVEYHPPQDVFDLLFRIRGESLDIDHAWPLARALQEILPAMVCQRIGVHGVRLPESGNGWMRPQEPDAEIPLSRRARLAIRLHEDDRGEVQQICRQRLRLERQLLEVGEVSVRPLGVSPTLHSRAVTCNPDESETDFLERVADQLRSMNIDVGKMICGKSGTIRTGAGGLFTRALLVADLSPEESIRLQRDGLGEDQLIGCGLFVPHKGIDAVYSIQE